MLKNTTIYLKKQFQFVFFVFNYQITDNVQTNFITALQTITFEASSQTNLTSTETIGNIYLSKDDFGDAYIMQSGSDEAIAVTAFGMSLGDYLWDGWTVVGAENINGSNYLAWQYYDRYSGNYAIETWEMNSDWSEATYNFEWNDFGTDGFYTFETNFNQDFDGDGEIGGSANQAPIQMGPTISLPDLNVGEQYTLYGSDLLMGYGDPDGDDISIGTLYTDYGNLVASDSSPVGYLPISETESLELMLGEDSVTFTLSLIHI